jgi:hypothetical protein
MKGGILIMGTEIVNGFRGTIVEIPSFDESEGASFHSFSLAKDQSVGL